MVACGTLERRVLPLNVLHFPSRRHSFRCEWAFVDATEYGYFTNEHSPSFSGLNAWSAGIVARTL
jgi:hypothetical protein